MKNMSHLTAGYESVLTRQINLTKPGMAHFAASGPLGTVCAQCAFYGDWKQVHDAAGNVVETEFRKGCCRKFHELTGTLGKAIPPNTESCRYFKRGDEVS
jgi:hypothetical protein